MKYKPAILLFVLICCYDYVLAQNDSVFLPRQNAIQINLISLPPLINDLNQKWLGIEYERKFNAKYSASILVDFGLFEDYTFTKYYNFFDEDEGFYHITSEVEITGYHCTPSFRYNLLKPKEKRNISIYLSPKLDFYQYFLRKDTYNSFSGEKESINNSTHRLNVGFGTGIQYTAFSRLRVDLNIAIFTKVFAGSSNPQLEELYPENSFWKSDSNNSWATINFMLGYSFGRQVKYRSGK